MSSKAVTVKKVHGSAPKTTSRSIGKYPLTAYEHLHIGIVEASLDGKYIDANEEFCRILGYSKKELLRLGIRDCTYEDDYALDIKLHERLVSGEIPFYGLEKRFVRKDGGIVWVELTRSLVSDEDGKPVCTIGVVLDISDRKGVERALRESVESLRLATEAARMFKWELDFQKQIYTFADNFVQVLGFSAGLLPQNSVEAVWKLSPPEDAQAISEAIAKAVESHRDLYSLQYRMINPEDGRVVWLEANAKVVYDEAGNAQRMFGVAQNITHNKKTQDEIRVVSRMPEENPNPVMRLTPDGRVSYANPASAPLLESWKHDADPVVPNGLQKAVMNALASRMKTEVEIEHRERIFSCTLAPVPELGYVNLYGKDITERKRVERAVAEYARQQESLYRLSDELHHTDSLEGVYDAALNAILNGLQCDRTSILLFDDTGVMRFVAWHGLSDGYRKATEGHSPWTADEKNPYPVCVSDIHNSDLSDSLKATILAEGINSLVFIPLVLYGKLIGKFMAYFNRHHQCSDVEIELGLMIARQLAFGIDRKRAEERLRANEALYRAIARSIPGGGVYVVDKDFRYLVAEGSVTEAFGLTREMLEGHTVSEVFPDERGVEMEDRLRRNFAGETVNFETEYNGRVYWTQQAPLLDSIGQAIVLTIDITGRKQAEEALRIENERFMRFFNSNIVGILIGNTSGKVVLANDYYLRLLGVSRQDLIDGKVDWKQFTPPEWLSADEKAIQELRERGVCEPYEKEYVRADGTRVPIYVADAMLPGPGEEIAAFVLDITERKQAEEALRQSEERFARFMQHLPGLAWIKDVQGRYVFANAAAEKAFGTPREKLYGKTDTEVFPPEVAIQFKQNDEQALTSQKGVQTVETLPQEDGVLHYSLVTKFPIPGLDGNMALIGGTAFDITERLQAEEALRQSEEHLRAILSQATAGIVRKDGEGRFIFVNQAYCDMLGYTESELLGKTFWEFVYPEDREENKRLYDRMILEGTPFKLEKRLLRKDGSLIWVGVSVSPVMDAEGKTQSAVAVEVDITGRKQAEDALQQLNLQLENRVQKRTATIQAMNQSLREEIAERKRIEEALRQSEETALANEEKLRTLFDLLPVGISFLDLDGRILQMNSALPDIVRLSREQLFGQAYKPRKYIRANGTPMPPGEFASARALRENKTIYNVETGIVLENGETIWTSVSAAPVDVADVGVVTVTVDITDSKRAERDLKESHRRLSLLSQRLVEVQEDERRALARELHDRVGQTLAALNINLIIINDQLSAEAAQQIGARLNDSMKLVAETIALVRDVMTDLRPAVLDDYGLEAALESQLSKFTSRYNIKVVFEKPDRPIPRLGPSVEMTFLRIAQEALMNIARHSRAETVNLTLRQEEEAICLSIRDDGIGIASWQDANRPGSHGLTIMRERADAFGGKLKVSSVPGAGTTVEVTIPFKNDDREKVEDQQL
ncbi:MAG TPA: PAS domain S-box protein [Anaerolineales bacterium]|nr:PAS domain S-box protein [Anaerolineales bacterium]